MIDNNTRREMIRKAIEEGRATYLPAGARSNATARILVDGVEAAQASLMETYTDPATASRFQEVPLITREEWIRRLNAKRAA